MSDVKQLWKNSLDSLIQEYRINIDATRPVIPRGSKPSEAFRAYQVESSNFDLYLIDTPMTRRVACHPHVVGKELERLVLEAADQTWPALVEFSGLGSSEDIVFEQILRAAPGYRLHEAAQRHAKGSTRTVFVRPRYTQTSYREHDGVVPQHLQMVYEDFSQIPTGKSIALVMQDTVASGKSGEMAIKAALDHCERVGSRITKWILYGFISSRGLSVLERAAKRYGLDLVAFAMGNLTTLCSNNYDMPLYGVDEALWARTHSINKLGALVARETLEDYAPEFIPGADQPGDWSARQLTLFTGTGYESGNIRTHLENSIRLIESLLSIGNFLDWQKELALKELVRLKDALALRTVSA